MKVLGLLEKAGPDALGAAEAADFAAWLAEPAQVAALGNMIGRDLVPAAGAVRSGGHTGGPALCSDRRSGAAALIFGHIAQSGDAALGGLLAAAAEANARIVIWYLTELTPAHRATLDWLGRMTGQSLAVHVIEVEFWRVGENALAPRLSLALSATPGAASPAPASAPAPAAPAAAPAAATPEPARPLPAAPVAAEPAAKPEAEAPSAPTTEHRAGDPAVMDDAEESPQECLAYWTAFVARAAYTVPGLRLGPPEGSPFLTTAIADGVHLFCGLSKGGRLVRTGIVLDGEGAPALFAALSDARAPLEKALDAPLVWDAGTDHGRPNLYISLDETDPGDRADWPRQHRWLAETARRLHAAIGPKIAAQGRKTGDTTSEDSPA